jgi:hypothetical protein
MISKLVWSEILCMQIYSIIIMNQNISESHRVSGLDVRVWTGFIWLKIRSSDKVLQKSNVYLNLTL